MPFSFSSINGSTVYLSETRKRYRAFISYSQVDKRSAKYIQRALERYRLPKGTIASGVHTSSRRLGRFFRDDDELAASPDLGAALRGAIEDSESLIVICSPNAAKSHWVNKEVLHFKRTGRATSIFGIIVAGTPNSEDPKIECFPLALRFSIDADGNLTNQSAEVLALDIRKERFSRLLVRLVSGLLGVKFDDLWRRDERRQRFRIATYTGAILLTVFSLIFAFFYVVYRSKVENLALEAQELVEQRRYSSPGRGASNEPLIGQRRIYEALPFAVAALPTQDHFLSYSGQIRDCGSFGAQPAGRCAALRISFAIPTLTPGIEPLRNADSTSFRGAPMSDALLYVQNSQASCHFPSKSRLKQLWTFQQGRVHVVTFEIDDGSDYGTTSYAIYEHKKTECQLSPVQHRRYIAAVDYQPESQAVVTASGDNNVVVWYAESNNEQLDVFSHGWHVRDVAFVGQKRIITHTESGDVWIWDLVTDAEILRIDGTQQNKIWFETSSLSAMNFRVS